MSAYASALVDIHFISADTGFVSGRANPSTDGGVVLYTTDGGASWTVKHKTMVAGDMIWKLQTPDNKHYFGSVEALPGSGNVRMIKSADKGASWTDHIVFNGFRNIQTIGFLDSLHGWTGGSTTLFETTDGGATWDSLQLGSSYNRFFRINAATAYLSGHNIYKYSIGSNPNGIKTTVKSNDVHSLNVSPNPASQVMHIDLDIATQTNCILQLHSTDGKVLQTLTSEPVEKGRRQFDVSLDKIAPQVIYVVLKTNEGMIYRKVIKQ